MNNNTPQYIDKDTTQSLNFSGNLKITNKWKIGFRSGYDFDEKELTYSSIDIYRDLHCWEMLFNWIPLGYHKSYTLTIRVKAAVLRDQISAIESVSERQKIVSQKNDDSDIIALANDKREAWVELFKIRKGKLIGREHFLMEGAYPENESGLIEQFMQQFYEVTTDIPKAILVQHPLLNLRTIREWLKLKTGHS